MPTLNWIGKEKVISHHQDVPYRVLDHQYGFIADPKTGIGKEGKEPTDSGNKIIHGDNLEALKSLLPEYEGKIKCIYIDPPYNTGNESWVYNDNVNHPKIKKWLGEVVGKDGEDLSRHDKWLCMMYPRLKLLHKLLAEDGVIFISIDDNEQANLKLICDEVFGVRNFVANIIWQKRTSPDARLNLGPAHDFILCYSKDGNSQKRFNLLAPSIVRVKAYKNIDDDPRGPWTSVDLTGQIGHATASQFYQIRTTGGTFYSPPKDRCWALNESSFIKLKEDNRIWFGKSGNSRPRLKRFLNEIEGVTAWTWWTNEEVGHNQEATKELKKIFHESTYFETPKPSRLIEKILNLSSNKKPTILDSFAGSGTTAHAVLNLNKQDGGNRKFILIEMEEYANDITAERVKRVANGYKYNGKEKETLESFPTNITQLKKADKIVESVEQLKRGKSYSSVKIESIDGRIAIVGEKQISGRTEGLSGSFDFYQLGLPLFDENQNLNETVDLTKIQEYIWFSETRSSFVDPNTEQYFLGKKDDAAYYFIYEKEHLTTLDYDALELIKTQAEQYIIYADNCLLPKGFMAKHNIIFKKIPRDITRF